MDWITAPCASPDQAARDSARARQAQLTKPPGSLGRLEEIAELFAGWQGREQAVIKRVGIRVFAADHGIAARGVSAFPAEVTVQMITNFLHGGAAISVLARQLDADFAVANMGTCTAVADAPGLHQYQLMPGTKDFSRGPAMPPEIVNQAINAGRDEVNGLDCELFVGGEMGIGNTSSAAAIVAAITHRDVHQLVGRGTGIDDASWERKCTLIRDALELHRDMLSAPLALLSALGGLEIAALAGAYLRCAQRGMPILMDGFIATAAALVACEINADVRQWLIASHQSAEIGHAIALEHLQLRPLLQLDMRLGEGSGAAVAVSLIQSALMLHRDMATFTEAGVAAGAT